jgi:hypothetical protein
MRKISHKVFEALPVTMLKWKGSVITARKSKEIEAEWDTASGPY